MLKQKKVHFSVGCRQGIRYFVEKSCDDFHIRSFSSHGGSSVVQICLKILILWNIHVKAEKGIFFRRVSPSIGAFNLHNLILLPWEKCVFSSGGFRPQSELLVLIDRFGHDILPTFQPFSHIPSLEIFFDMISMWFCMVWCEKTLKPKTANQHFYIKRVWTESIFKN